MGYNPFRKHRTTFTDYAVLAVACLVSAIFVLWATGLL
jgi:hypothetical protein